MSTTSDLPGREVRRIAAAETRELRQRVLRPDGPPSDVIFPGDDAPETMHYGAYSGDLLMSVGSVYIEDPPWDEVPWDAQLPHLWRLRGMATEPEAQGGGYGTALLQQAVEDIAGRGGQVLWFNARTGALRFYQRLGFIEIGEEFDIPGAGPHYVMWRAL